jgi:hypothetical protein
VTRPMEELFDELSGPALPFGPTDWPEPSTLRRRAEHRRTVRRVSVGSSVAVLAAVAVAVPAILSGQRASTTSPIGSTPSPAQHHAAPAVLAPKPTSTAGRPLVAGAVTPTGVRETFGNVSLVIPAGWKVHRSSGPKAYGAVDSAYHRACVYDPAAGARSLFGCAGLDIWYDGFLPGDGTAKFNSNRNLAASWHHGTATATCPRTAGGPTVAAVLPLSATDQSRWTFPKVGDTAKAVYNVWDVACADGTSFSPQAWFLPKSMVLFFSYDANPAAQALLSTVIATH